MTRISVVFLVLFFLFGCANTTTTDVKQDKYFIGELIIPMSFEEVLEASLERQEVCGDSFTFYDWDQSKREPSKAFLTEYSAWSGQAGGVASYWEIKGDGEITTFRIWATSTNAPSYIYRNQLDESLIGILQNPTDC